MNPYARIDALLAGGHNASAHALAVECVRRAPQDADAVYYRAKCEWALGDLAATRMSLDALASMGAERFAAYHLLKARLHDAANERADAIASLQRATGLDDRAPDAWVHLGHLHARAGRMDQAAQAYRAALSIDPDDRDALRAMGTLAAETFDFPTAKACLSGLLEKTPGDEGALNLLSFVHGELGEDQAALNALHTPTPQPPSVSRRARGALFLPQISASREHIAAQRGDFARGLEDLDSDSAWIASESELFSLAHSNFLLAYHGEDDLPLQRRYGQLIRSRAARFAPQWLEPSERKTGIGTLTRIRVGFLSSFFRQCTIGSYFEHWITDLDPARFERVVFTTGWQPDALGERLRAAADRFEVLRGGAQEVARTVRAADLDILVYPEVGMGAQNCLLSHLRLARVQCAAWGHPVTTGSAEIDAFVSCAAMEPERADAHYAERLILFPGIGTRYARPAPAAALAREDLQLPAGAHLYVCPQSLFKIHPDNDDLFLDIAARDPNAVFLFFQAMYPAIGAAFSRRIALAAERRGIDARGRFRFVPRQPEAGFRA
ncbi:MAG: tetratricopeptide repeat protein, partial [Betaproteobacteria bacterium]|nr:tetratricopeptide repeat protein [Betaproteobacteria bacterium]